MKRFGRKTSAIMLSFIMGIGICLPVNAVEQNNITRDSSRGTKVSDARPSVGIYNFTTGKFITYDRDGNEIVTCIGEGLSKEEISDYKKSLDLYFETDRGNRDI